MSSSMRFRQVLKQFVVGRLIYNWTRRKCLVSSVVRKCRSERGFHEVIQCFRYAFFKPSRTFFLSVTAAYHNKDEKDGNTDAPNSCKTSITDEDLKALMKDFDNLDELSYKTLFCGHCLKRIVFDKKQKGVSYCSCKDAKPLAESYNGWEPFIEAEDVVIWRKDYKGTGMYAYKVYGHYNDVRAEDFAAVHLDGAYRRVWDDAVVSLSVVERRANGVADQSLLHWEVLWPRLFANRDYVYMRRHKEFDGKTRSSFYTQSLVTHQIDDKPKIERENVHTRAKLKSLAEEKKAKVIKKDVENKTYVIVSRSCEDSRVPETNNAVRVKEYWSHMVIRTLNGPEVLGTEFVLTYYDEPAVGGMPTAIASFAASRGALAFLAKMRRAATQYAQWRRTHRHEEQDFMPFSPERLTHADEKSSEPFSEHKMESSKSGIDLESETVKSKYDKQTQTDGSVDRASTDSAETEKEKPKENAQQPQSTSIETEPTIDQSPKKTEENSTTDETRQLAETPETIEKDKDSRSEAEKDSDKADEEEEKRSVWYKYMYPFYYYI